jgi:hypothetical protein
VFLFPGVEDRFSHGNATRFISQGLQQLSVSGDQIAVNLDICCVCTHKISPALLPIKIRPRNRNVGKLVVKGFSVNLQVNGVRVTAVENPSRNSVTGTVEDNG